MVVTHPSHAVSPSMQYPAGGWGRQMVACFLVSPPLSHHTLSKLVVAAYCRTSAPPLLLSLLGYVLRGCLEAERESWVLPLPSEASGLPSPGEAA